MAKNTETEAQVQEIRFRGKGEENEYRILLDGEDIGRVKRTEADKWTLPRAPKDFEPTSRKNAAIALSKLAPEQVKVMG
jgi:hypothetical protein